MGLFDVRNIVGALLFLYGVILVVASFGTSDAQKAKADGINANLWVGLVLVVARGALRGVGGDPADRGRRGAARA